MNETMMTISGNLVDNPNLRRTNSGTNVASFRVASTQRRFDRETGTWVDGETLFVTVTAWRGMAENVNESLRKGMPVIAHGRYRQREYEKNEMLKTAYELEAVSVGPDLARGTARFERVVRTATPQLDTDDTGAPHDLTDEYVETDEGSVDPATGEVHELASA